MTRCRVLMSENARYMDESERSDHGIFPDECSDRRVQSDGR